jgi:hypothetical protein
VRRKGDDDVIQRQLVLPWRGHGWFPGITLAEQLRFAFRAEFPGKWLISSAVTERLDAGLWTWFEVTG